MPSSPVPRFSELRLVLEPEHGELVRAFVREAALAEAVPASVASLVADDAVEAWQALCTPDAGRERARIELLCSRREVRTRILLPGYSRFSHVVASLAGRIRRDAGVSCHEHGIDGWEVSVHRSLNADAEPSPAADEPATETPVAAPAVAAAARDYVIDLPQKTDAAAIARWLTAENPNKLGVFCGLSIRGTARGTSVQRGAAVARGWVVGRAHPDLPAPLRQPAGPHPRHREKQPAGRVPTPIRSIVGRDRPMLRRCARRDARPRRSGPASWSGVVSIGLLPDGLQAAKARGVRLGNPNLSEAAAIGRARLQETAQKFAANVLPAIRELQAVGVTSHNAIAKKLNERNVPTRRGRKRTHVQVAAALTRGAGQPELP